MLRDALADMFGLPPLPLPLPAPAGPAIPMDAISESESRRDESRQSPAKSTVPSTRAHSPDPEVPDPEPKRTNTWDLKDPAHPLHRWGAQQAYKGWLDQQRTEAEQSPEATSPPTHRSTPPGLEDIPEEEEEPIPVAGPSTMPGALSPTSPSDP